MRFGQLLLGGRVVTTAGIAAIAADVRAVIVRRLQASTNGCGGAGVR